MDRLKQFPALQFGEYLYTEGRIILLDVETGPSLRQSLLSLKTIDLKELIVLDASVMSGKLASMLEDSQWYGNNSQVLTVFPGNGSLKPKDFLRMAPGQKVAYAFAKRYWKPGENPLIHVGEIQTESFLHPEITTIIAIDDVVSSGQTMQKLCERNAWKFPRASWHAATWLTQVPRQKGLAGINGYAQMIAAFVAEGPNGKLAPINSLSTLQECPEIAASYARRHFADPQQFLSLIGSDQASLVCLPA